ncbi:hypothetical protein EPM78_01600 [Neisseria gonorrhoeae]|uniref:Uncharacterized protein n=1 Tax=Neisseria gonorrhoeae TaxID=485 RepID=A0AAX2TN31_NEIGO|nr:hypothetical protein A6J43_04535 [Neisseria gonorrhoeae]EEZ50453.1 predicted protein [Neisseria gonorrhoeae PID18]EEZ52799.1 predicted protein [Neisseria gonorrhoeae PID1]EEZ57294.1 predicted protein [Neisseria gonorrhoeae SK-92-679]ARC01848.1 hypothetical protein A6J44_11200 [Neisseria gonorrhoeae]
MIAGFRNTDTSGFTRSVSISTPVTRRRLAKSVSGGIMYRQRIYNTKAKPCCDCKNGATARQSVCPPAS